MRKFQFSVGAVAPLFIGLSIILSGCSSNEERPEYVGAGSVESLEIPPKLTAPDTSGALKLPEPSREAREKFGKADAGEAIAPRFEGIRLKHENGIYFLELDSVVQDVWNMLPGFLAAEGIELDRIEKLMGFVDTRWMDEYQVTYGGEESSSWFSGFSPDYKDKFRIRVEADVEPGKTRLYVAHRGMQIVIAEDGTQWQQRQAEAELEREILYRFMLYAGAGKDVATQELVNYTSYQPRAKGNDDTPDRFTVIGDQHAVWLRLKMAADRVGVEIVSADEASGEILVKVGNLKKVENNPEEGSWLGRLFTSKDIVVDEDETYQGREYKEAVIADEDRITIRIKQVPGPTKSEIQLSHKDGSKVEFGLGADLRNALLKQLK